MLQLNAVMKATAAALVRDARPRRLLYGVSLTCAVPQAGRLCSQDFQPDCLRRRHRAAAEQGKAAAHATQVVSRRKCQAVIRLRKNVDTIKVVHNSGKAEPRLSADIDDRQLFGAINEVMPQFKGGVNAMADYVKSSVDSIMVKRNLTVDSRSAGRCVVSFTVRKDGSIADVKVVKKLNDAFDSVAVDVVKGMPRWNPGKRNGKCIDARYAIPIIFRVYPDDVQPDKMQQ